MLEEMIAGKQLFGEAKVVYVKKENAKTVKGLLKKSNFLDDRYRMLPASLGSDVLAVKKDANSFIAIPVYEEFDEKTMEEESHHDNDLESMSSNSMIVGIGHQACPFSSKVLGNGGAKHHQFAPNSDKTDKLSLLHSVILDIDSTISDSNELSLALDQGVINRVLQLDSIVCPVSRRRQFLEILGDDRTVVVPPGAFEGEEFLSILRDVYRTRNRDSSSAECKLETTSSVAACDEFTSLLYNKFWHRLAVAHGSHRVVRRGIINANSKIRESGHQILWPPSTTDSSDTSLEGPQSPSWICVTEQGVKQSFDLSKVMFSRGNISEKIRFGKHVVQEDDVVLDMYAGIGYYTLPAVIHGKASKVYACEWNEHAVNALRFNVKDNKIQDKVEIFLGDCRQSAKRHNIVDLVDRVCLGLLPSSEGGWRTAVRALKVPSGGWLHVHANVSASERETWTCWLCYRLSVLAREELKPHNWFVLCDHVERVKSFAPTVFHYVADVFVGVPTETSYPRGHKFLQQGMIGSASSAFGEEAESPLRTWVRRQSDQSWLPVLGDTVVRPSCALSPEGVLCQEWMR